MSWSERLAQKEAEKAARKQAEQPAPEVASPAAPAPAQLPADGVLTTFEQSAPEPVKTADNDLDTFIKELRGNILKVYAEFVGKMTPTVLPGQVENIMISCPHATHEDRNPSAWVNTESNTWVCAKCGGGDALEMIAAAWGWPDYKQGKRFNDLRREIAKRYGWVIENQNGFEVALSPKAIEERNKKLMEEYAQQAQTQPDHMVSLSPIEMGSSSVPPESVTPTASVVSIETGEEVEEEEPYDPSDFEINRGFPLLDWESVVKEGTFLDEYMKEAIIDYAPVEYHFFNALTALSLAVGRNVYSKEFMPLYGNLYVCNIGETAIGKSNANYALSRTLYQALPWDKSDISRQGVNILNMPGSGEALIGMFKGTIKTKISEIHTGRIKGFLFYDELSEFIKKSSNKGSILKDITLKLYNSPKEITSESLTHGDSVATDPFFCFTTSVQPGVIRSLLTKDDSASGFLNRFFFVTGRYRKQPGIKKKEVTMQKASALLKGINLWSQGNVVNGVPQGLGALTLDLAAEMKYNNWHDGTFEPLKTRADSSEIEKRLDMVVKKLALLFAINDMSSVITEEHYDLAFSLLPFMQACARIVDEKVNLSLGSEMEKDVIDLIQSEQDKAKKRAETTGKPFQPKWVSMKFIRDRRKKYDSQELVKCLDTLTKLGVLHGVNNPPRSGPGKPILGMAYIPAESA